MNVMYYGMVNGYHGYYPSSALTGATPSGGNGLLGSGAAGAGITSALATAGAPLTNQAAAAGLMRIMPNFSSTQIQYMFRHRMDKGAKVNRAVKCDTCGITLNSEQQAQQHYIGKNHLKKLRGIGKKKEGKDGEESDKDSDRRKSRDRKNRKRDKDKDDDGDSKNGDGDDDDDESNEAKDDKNDQSEGSKSDDEGNKSEDDEDNDNESSKDSESVKSDCHSSSSSRNDDMDSKENGSDDLNRSKVGLSGHCDDSDDLQGSKCKNSSQNQSQIGESHIKSDTKVVVEESLGHTDAPGATENACDNETETETKSGESSCHTPPNGLISRSTPHSVTPSSSSPANHKSSFRLPNGAVRMDTTTYPDISPSVTSSGTTTSYSRHLTVHSSSSQYLPSRCTTSHSSSALLAPSPRSSPLASYQSLKRTHSPLRSAHHSHGNHMVAPSIQIPHKKPRNSYLGGPLGGVPGAMDIRSNLLASPHIAMTPNSIPGFAAMQPTMRHLASETLSQGSQPLATVLRPMLPTPASLPSQVSAYGAQYGALQSYQTPQPGSYNGATQPTFPQVNPASYQFPYPTLLGSDLNSVSSLPRGVLNPYYPTGVTGVTGVTTPLSTPHMQLTQADPLTSTSDLLACDLSSYLASSKDLIGQQMSMKYASALPTSTGLPAGFQYRAISIQALNSNPAYQNAAVTPFTSTPSPPYRSISVPTNGATAPSLPGTMIPTASQVTPVASSDDPKLDPVSQAVYDNVLGKLPLKRKREIPCTTCGIIFNSDAQATAHFTGSKHMRKQKLTEVAEEVAARLGADSQTTTAASATPSTSTTATEAMDTAEGGAMVKVEAHLIRCEVCDLDFNHQEQAEVHMRGAKHNKRAKIAEAKAEGLPEGVSVKSWGNVFNCSICNTTVNSIEQLEMHRQGEEHQKKIRYCRCCDLLCDSREDLHDHKQTGEHFDKRVAYRKACYCTMCDAQCQTPEQFTTHLLSRNHMSHVESENVFCDICDIQFACLYDLDAHKKEKSHRDMRIMLLFCPLCKVQMQSLLQMENHRNSKQHLTNEEDTKSLTYCKPCNRKFDEPHEKQQHEKTVKHQRTHAAYMVKLYCDRCKVQCDNEYQFTKHEKSNSHKAAMMKQGQGFCGICDIDLNSSVDFENHIDGKQHKAKELQRRKTENPNSRLVQTGNIALWSEVPGHEPGWLYCQTCNISVRTGLCLKQHVQNTTHKNNVASKSGNSAGGQ